MNDIEAFKHELIKNACYRMDESLRMIEIALSKIEEEAIWKRPNENSNSIGNQLLHLCGNIAQYAIASLGEEKDVRNRPAEFEAKGGYSKEQLLAKLKQIVETAKSMMEGASNIQLIQVRSVQGYSFSGIGIIIHVVEHFSYHTGQISFWVKQITNKQLGFYDGVDLNTRNND